MAHLLRYDVLEIVTMSSPCFLAKARRGARICTNLNSCNIRGKVILLAATLVFLSGCDLRDFLDPPGVRRKKINVTAYIGKTADQIINMLGEPTGKSDAVTRTEELERKMWQVMGVRPLYSKRSKDLIYIRRKQRGKKRLPDPLRELIITLSANTGRCYLVQGLVKDGGTTPETLLDTIRFGGREKKVIRTDQMGFAYRIPPYEEVTIYRRGPLESSYVRFRVYDMDMKIARKRRSFIR